MKELAQVRTSALEIGYEHSGATDAPIVVLLHGYPFDVRAFDGVVPILNEAGFRTIVPFLRGYGPTRFLSLDTPRSGEQAALGMDLLVYTARFRGRRCAYRNGLKYLSARRSAGFSFFHLGIFQMSEAMNQSCRI
jgi:pimeloyl-ACP methyl ester carboxylesterase